MLNVDLALKHYKLLLYPQKQDISEPMHSNKHSSFLSCLEIMDLQPARRFALRQSSIAICETIKQLYPMFQSRLAPYLGGRYVVNTKLWTFPNRRSSHVFLVKITNLVITVPKRACRAVTRLKKSSPSVSLHKSQKHSLIRKSSENTEWQKCVHNTEILACLNRKLWNLNNSKISWLSFIMSDFYA